MRLYTFTLTLCVCALHVRAASISTEKKLGALDNVDLDNVAVEPELVDQVTVKEVDNHLRKTVVDIPVRIVEEQKIVDENSNDYVPSNEGNIIIKRVEIDLNNPGPPQRQEHETQNPENYGEMEKALFGIKSTIDNTQTIFTTGLQGVKNSLSTLLENNVNIPEVQQNIQNLRQTFTDQIVKLNETIRSNLRLISSEKNEESENNLNVIESRLENIQTNFKTGIDTLNEGVEILTILKEEDDIAKANPKSVITEDEAVKADTPVNNPQPANTGSPGASVPTGTIPTGTTGPNIMEQFMTNFQNTMSNAVQSLTSIFQNPFNNGNAQNQPQRPDQSQQTQGSVPVGAQSDTTVVATTQAPQWNPLVAIAQNLQNAWQSLINPGQNNQGATQPIQQTVQPTTIVQQQSNPSPPPAKVPEQTQADAVPIVAQPQQLVPVQQPVPQAVPIQQQQPAAQAVPIQQQQPVQSGPIQQLVQNNPIIKGIQTVFNRIQNPPKPETPRNEIVKIENEEESDKGHGHRPNFNNPNFNNQNVNNQNGGNSDIVRVEEPKEIVISTKGVEEIVGGEIKAEETKIPSLSEKTEEVVL